MENMVSAGYDPSLILALHAISDCDTAPWQPILGLPRRRQSSTQQNILRKLSIIGAVTDDKDAYTAQYMTFCPVARGA